MSHDLLISLVSQYGYAALFFSLWLGIVGMPIPDEVIVMTGGMVASLHVLHPVPAFLVTYLGVCSGLSLGYVLGRKAGAPLLDRLVRKKGAEKFFDRSQRLIERYGGFALCLSYFLPVVRHLIPYLVGINKMPFRKYALCSYTTGFLWTLLFFSIGSFFGNYIDNISSFVNTYEWYLLAILTVLAIVWLAVRGAATWKIQRS